MQISRIGVLLMASFTRQILAEQAVKMKRTVFRETIMVNSYAVSVLKLLIGFVVLFFVGCKSPSKETIMNQKLAGQKRGTIVVPAMTRTEGKVVRTNLKLNFVVLDFGFKRLPQAGQKLGIYRLGEKIGQVRVSGPFWETYTVADIVDGEIWVGDEAKLK